MADDKPEEWRPRGPAAILNGLADRALEHVNWLYPETRAEQRERVARARKKRAAKAAKSGHT